MTDTECIRRCLVLAAQGRGVVGNGAMVGAVLVRDDKIIAEGWHRGFGKAHAERDLLEAFTGKVLPTDTLYINLEPCVGFPGKKTAPCSDLLIERGVKRVVCGMPDPNSHVERKGIQLLRSKGVEVSSSCLPEECARLNRGYVSVRTKGRPWIVKQQARMVTGEFASPDGSFLKITTHEQDIWTHTYLRARNDAVLIGIGTALIDNPSLTIRHIPTTWQPWRIVLDSRFRLPMHAKLVSDEHASRTIIVLNPAHQHGRDADLATLRSKGVRIVPVKHGPDGVDFPSLWHALITPVSDYNGLTSILFEGGQRLWEVFTKAGCIDEEAIMIGKKALPETRQPLTAA